MPSLVGSEMCIRDRADTHPYYTTIASEITSQAAVTIGKSLHLANVGAQLARVVKTTDSPCKFADPTAEAYIRKHIIFPLSLIEILYHLNTVMLDRGR